MGHLTRRLVALEVGAARRPAAADLAKRELLGQLSLDELEALEGAIVAQKTGAMLTAAQWAALDVWERLAGTDDRDGGRDP